MKYHIRFKKRNNNPAQSKRFFSKPHLQRKTEGGELPFFQTKLTIGQPGDRYEQEADAMAERVVSGKQQQAPGVQAKCPACEREGPVLTKLQRMEGEEEEMQAKIQRQEEEEEMQAKPELQRQEEEEEVMQPKLMRDGKGNVQASPDLESRLQASKGGGQSLPRNTQEEMGQSFGADFSKVRVHTGSEASSMSQRIQAQAFTHGNDIYFNQGKYNPDSSEGKKLLAHELTHTIHQGAVK